MTVNSRADCHIHLTVFGCDRGRINTGYEEGCKKCLRIDNELPCSIAAGNVTLRDQKRELLYRISI